MILLRKILLYVSLLVINVHTCLSNIVLSESIEEFKVLGKNIELFEDASQKLSIQDIQSLPNHPFTNSKESELYSIHPSHTYWLRFKINNLSKEDTKWVLEILDSRFEKVFLYSPTNNGRYTIQQLGTRYSFDERIYEHKNFVFNLPASINNQSYFYLKIEPGLIGSFLFKIRTHTRFSSYAFKEHLLLGMYYGILAIMAFYNLFLFFSIREKIYIYYFFYVLSWAFSSLLDDGLGLQYVWRDIPVVSAFGYYLSKILLLTFYILYSYHFIDIKNNFPQLYFKKYTIIVICAIATIAFTFLQNVFLYNSLFILLFFSVLIISYKAYKIGYKPARFFLLGNSIIVIGLIIHMLKNAAVFNYWISDLPIVLTIMVYIKNISMVIDIVILSISLGDRIRFLKETTEKTQMEMIRHLNEKEQLSQKVNKELEEKVRDRTKTIEKKNKLLEDAYAKLKEKTEEINKMNALLDLDNWNLKKNILEEKEARITMKSVDYDEFSKVYPNESSCFLFIEDLKWEKGFECRKCGHSKFGKGFDSFSRRCIKCKYNESLTSYTLFNRCKFDIRAALFIVVMVNRYGKEISITDLSKQVKIRNATCWKFSQKILALRETKEYQKIPDDEKLKYLILNS